MKKTINFLIILLVTFSLTGCFKKDLTKNQEEVSSYPSNYIETIPENAKVFIENMDNIILENYNEISEMNAEIFTKSESMFDLNNIKSLKKEEILNYINSYQIPTLPKYNDDKLVTKNDIAMIIENQDIANVKDIKEIKSGLTINRTNLKSFPTDIHFFDEKNEKNFDNLQESELLLNTKVLILHESKDKNWYFVLTNAYAGWVKKENIALLTLDDENFFLNNKDFVIITESSLKINEKILDMSVKLPFLKTNENGYEVAIPTLDKDNNLTKEIVTISRDKAHIGYLDYTKRNVIIQAFKYENTPYSWGGMDQNVDCSSYVSNIYRTFGFNFPRNTKEQNKSVGEIISLKDKSKNEKLDIIKNKEPALLYQPGHVMLYLGKLDNKDYIIHASGSKNNMKVLVSILNDSSYLEKIDRINILN